MKMQYLIVGLLMLVAVGCRRADAGRELLVKAAESRTIGDAGLAMTQAAEALDAGLDSVDAAEAYLIIAESHRKAGNAQAALEFTRRAAACDPRSCMALVDAAVDADSTELALSLLAQSVPGDSAERVEWLRRFAASALMAEREAEAMEALRELYGDSVLLSLEMRAALARDYVERGERDSADQVMGDVDIQGVEDAHGLDAYADYLAACGRNAEAIDAMRRSASVRDSMMASVAASGVYNRLYDIEHQRRMEDVAKRQRDMWIVIGVAGLLVLLCGAGFYVQRSRAQRRLLESENRLLMASKELREIGEYQRSTMGRLFRSSYESIEMAANLILDGAASSRVMKELTARVENSRTPEFLKQLETAVNECRGDLMTRMRGDMTLSDADVATALFCAAGLSPRVVCLLLNCTPSALYNKKYRLKRKILEADVTEEIRKEYLSILS